MVRPEQQKFTLWKLVRGYKVVAVPGRDSDFAPDIHVEFAKIDTGSVVSIHLSPGQSLVCRGGRLWITRSGDPVDYWLMPGESLRFSQSCMLVVEADGTSAFALHGLVYRANAGANPMQVLSAWLRRAECVLSKQTQF